MQNRSATKLIFEFIKKEHPLGKSIDPDEVPSLVSGLRQRLGVLPDDLDLSPRSLRILEKSLYDLRPQFESGSLRDEELLQIVREVAAYIGEVLVLHSFGKWQTQGTLWGTDIIFEGNIKITKEGEQRVTQSLAMSLGNLAAAAIDMVSVGKMPELYKYYMIGRKKKFQEKL